MIYLLCTKKACSRGDAESYQRLEQVAIELSDACAGGEKIRVNKASAKMLETIESLGILKNMEAFQWQTRYKSYVQGNARLYAHGRRDDGFH